MPFFLWHAASILPLSVDTRYTAVMSAETVFHKILRRELPATIVFEADEVVAFLDIHPKAKTHVLFVPTTFVESIAAVDTLTEHIPGMLIRTAQHFAQERGIDGYRLQFNVGKGGGQEVPYLHLHLLSDQSLAD